MVVVDLHACSLALLNAALLCCKIAHDEIDYAVTLCVKDQVYYSEKVALCAVDMFELCESDCVKDINLSLQFDAADISEFLVLRSVSSLF